MYQDQIDPKTAASGAAPIGIRPTSLVVNAASIALGMSLLAWAMLAALTIFFLTHLTANMESQDAQWSLALLAVGLLLSLVLSLASPILAAVALFHRGWKQTTTTARKGMAAVALVLGLLAIPSVVVIGAWIMFSAAFIGG